jgi:hypothetical protein
MARARARIYRFGALVALLLLATVALSALTHPAGAQQLPDGDDEPSCSLFPTRLGVGEWFFTNRRDFTITLQIVRADGEVVFDGSLAGGESTPIFALTPNTVIHWAGGTYHVTAYDLVNCLDLEGPLPTTTTVAPPTTVAPLTTVPDTTPFSVPPETTTAPPTPTSSAAPTTAAAETLAPVTEPVAVAGVVVAREDVPADEAVAVARPLPTTGFPVGLVALGAGAVIFAGLTCLAVSRRPA